MPTTKSSAQPASQMGYSFAFWAPKSSWWSKTLY